MTYPADSYPNIPKAFYDIAEKQPNAEVYSQAVPNASGASDSTPRHWRSVNYRACQERVLRLANYFQSIGVIRGVKVAILSSSRPEWMEADLGALSAGATVVSIYQSLLAEDIAYILFDSGAEIVVAENQEQVDKLIELQSKPANIPATEDREAQSANISLKHIIALERSRPNRLVTQFDEILANTSPARPDIVDELTHDDIAALVYTSGTTGPPKGVVQSHRNHLANVRQCFDSGLITGGNSLMLFLPLAHSFAKLVGYLGMLTPATLKFAAICDRQTSKADPTSITRDIREGSADIVPVVPRLLEKMQAGIMLKANGGGVGGLLIGGAVRSALDVYAAKKEGRSAKPSTQLVYAITGIFRKKIREKLFGPNFGYALSGGAKLSVSVAEFFAALGVGVVEGYGLTETCVATNVNRIENLKIGSVGPVLSSDIELKLTDEGEILYRGPNVALGYYERPTATKASWDEDGWFHTGDLGSVDADGYLTIQGRKKEIIVTSQGKNVAPNDIEDQIKQSSYISQVMLVGEGRPYCVVLATLNEDEVGRWAKTRGIVPEGGYSSDSQVQKLIWSHVEKINAGLASYEEPKKLAIIPEEFTVENGLLTPTFKVKRNLVEKAYADTIEELYSS